MPSLEKEWNTTIRLLGYWWLADKPGSKVPGCLEIADGWIRLELIGTIENEVFGRYFGKPVSHPIIQGVAQGKFLTLVDCRTNGSEQNIGPSNSSPVSKVDVTYAIEGAHFANREELQFAEAIVRYHFLEDWVRDQPVKREFTRPDGTVFTKRFTVPADRSFLSSVDRSTFTLSAEYETSIEGHNDHFTFRNTLRFKPSGKRELQWFIDRSGSICHLLSFLLGRRTSVASFQLLSDKFQDEPRRPLLLFSRHIAFAPAVSNLHPHEMRYCFPMLRDRFADVVDFWLGRSDQLVTAFALVTGAHLDDSLPVQHQFLNCVHALECIDRALANRGYMSPEDYAKVRQAIAHSIPANLDTGHHDSLKKKIEYAYEYSLRKRLTEMLKELPDNLVAMICANSQSFPSLIADTRNYFAHYTQELKGKAVLDSTRLYWFSQQLSIWCTSVLLLEMGFSSEEVESGIRRCPRLRNIVDHGPEI